MTTNNSINNSLGNDLICKSVTLSSNDILNAFATPVQIIAAPGSGFVIQLINAELILKFNSVAYTAGGLPRLVWTGGSLAGQWATATVTASVSTQQGFGDGSGSLLTVENLGINFTNLTQAFATGNSTARIDVKYQILRIG